ALKVQFIVSVLHRPILLIFDEPFSGFDPINANILKREILRLRDEGATVIFSTHNMSSVETLCDDITLINNSKNILTGNVDEIRNRLGQNRYKITFEGDTNNLLTALGDNLLEYSVDIISDRENAITLKVAHEVSRRDLLRAATEAVDITSFGSALPSMDEIFISTVQQFNQK
ncbi:MAG: DUF4162 domain-containing protein, partial [Muribaculaceae bacterium]|nr:DUF4162 domain-containing protein [Muribaculaceae bacterium]